MTEQQELIATKRAYDEVLADNKRLRKGFQRIQGYVKEYEQWPYEHHHDNWSAMDELASQMLKEEA